jgi:hypothetical protein
MTTSLDRTGSPTPPPPTPPAPVVPTPPAAGTKTAGVWDHFKSYFFGDPKMAQAPEAKSPSVAEKLFCGKMGIVSAYSEESIQEGQALIHGFAFLFDGGKNILAETADKAVDTAHTLFDDPKGFFESLISGPRHSGPHAAVSGGGVSSATARPRPKPVLATVKK